MKTVNRIIVVSIIVVLAAASLAAAPTQQARTGFPGAWRGTDAGDGSKLTLSVTAGHQILYYDFKSAACGGGKVKGTGYGHVVGKNMVASLKLKCASNKVVVNPSYSITFSTTGQNALLDSYGNAYVLTRSIDCGR